MSADDCQDGAAGVHRSSPTGPRVMAPQGGGPPPETSRRSVGGHPSQGLFRPSLWSVTIFALLLSGIGVRAYRDLSRPDAWDYWRETYVSTSMTASVIPAIDIDGSGQTRRALAISGRIGPASAGWFRDQLDKAHLSNGDVVLLSSKGGSMDQAGIMGEIIRARGLATAVGTADMSGSVQASSCASACVLVYAGGRPRYGIKGAMLGVHRFTWKEPIDNPVAEAQRMQGMVLGYMTDMGVSSAIVEAMSQTAEIRWLSQQQALAMNLVTTPVDPR